MNVHGVLILAAGLILGFLCFLGGRRFKFAGGTLLGIAGCALVVLCWRERRISQGFEKVEVGDMREEISKVSGKPTLDADCSFNYYGKRGKLEPAPKGCVREYIYYSFFFPAAFEYSFGSDDRVLNKTKWESP